MILGRITNKCAPITEVDIAALPFPDHFGHSIIASSYVCSRLSDILNNANTMIKKINILLIGPVGTYAHTKIMPAPCNIIGYCIAGVARKVSPVIIRITDSSRNNNQVNTAE